MKKRLLGILMTLVMVIGLLPVTAFAADCENHAEACIEAVQELVDTLPDMTEIDEDNREEVTATLEAIDEAKLHLTDAEREEIDWTKYSDAAFVLCTPAGWFGFCTVKRYEVTGDNPAPMVSFINEDGEAEAMVAAATMASMTETELEPNGEGKYFYLPEGKYAVHEEVEGEWDLTLSVNGEEEDFFEGIAGRAYRLVLGNSSAPEQEPEVTEYPVWVGGVQLTFENAKDVFGDGKVSYDAGTNTLTLNNYSCTVENTDAIRANCALNLVLKGENNLTVMSSGGGIEVLRGGDLCITGDGSLTIKTGSTGIYAGPGVGVTITGCVVKIEAGYNGICVEHTYGENDGRNVTINGGNLTINASNNGIYASSGAVTIGGGTVRITAGDKGICAAGGNVGISGNSSLDIAADSGGIYAESSLTINGSNVKITAPNFRSYGIVTKTGDIAIDGGNISVQSGGSGMVSYKNIVISGGILDVKSEFDRGIVASNVNISGQDTKVNIKVDEKMEAIQGEVTISDGLKLTETESGVVVLQPDKNDTAVSSGKKKSSPRYDVDVNEKDIENGSVKINSSRAKKGSTVTITVTPDAGYELDELIITDKDGDEIEWKDKGDGRYSFVMPRGDVEIEASFKKIKEDVPAVGEKDGTELILTIGSKIVLADGEAIVNDAAPMIRESRTFLPIRIVAEELGADVAWNEAEQTVTIAKDDLEIMIYIGQPFATVNGEPVALDAPAFIENDRTYLPIRFVAENLGAEVIWDGAVQTVTIMFSR